MTKKVLLINGSKSTHQFMAVALKGIAEISSAYSLKEGLEILKTSHVDAVFTEIYAIGSNASGRHLTEKEVGNDTRMIIGSIQELTTAPIFVYTGQAFMNNESVSLEAGAKEFLLMCSYNSRKEYIAELVDQI